MSNEYEVLDYDRLKHLKIFLNRITYRNYHFHNAFEELLIISGTGTITVSGDQIPLKKGTTVILNPYEAHEIDAAGGSLTAVILQISQNFCREYLPNFRKVHFLEHQIQDGSLLNACQNEILKAALTYFEEKDGFEMDCLWHTISLFRLLLSGVSYEILSDSDCATMKRKNLRMARFIAFIDENYLHPLRLSNLAELSALTPTHVSHLFSDYFGISFQEYLNNLRFEKAMTYVISTDLSQTEISAISGFSDGKYLSRMFRKRMGCSIREYRQNYREHNNAQVVPPKTPLEQIYSRTDSIQIISKESIPFACDSAPPHK